MNSTKQIHSVDDIPGWFKHSDRELFEFFLGPRSAAHGNLVELGAYLGKSAAHMAQFLGADERMIVCDLFGSDAEDDANIAENVHSYSSLERGAFEDNFRAVHGWLPVVVQAPASTITEHVEPGSARFVHVDASHLYEHVVVDIDSAETMLRPGGVVVFDDYRSPHTPGVAAAVWAAVARGRITPICLTWSKLYAVFGEAEPRRRELMEWLDSTSTLRWESQQIAGHDVVRIKKSSKTDAAVPSTSAKKRPAHRGGQDKLRKQLAQVNRRLSRIERMLDQQEANAGLRPMVRSLRSALRRRIPRRNEH